MQSNTALLRDPIVIRTALQQPAARIETSPGQRGDDAVAYQLLIMFMIAAATLSVIILCLLAFRIVSHPEHRILWNRIRPA